MNAALRLLIELIPLAIRLIASAEAAYQAAQDEGAVESIALAAETLAQALDLATRLRTTAATIGTSRLEIPELPELLAHIERLEALPDLTPRAKE